MRQHKPGSNQTHQPLRKNVMAAYQSTCIIDGCEKQKYTKFICQTHYGRLRDTGSTRLYPKAKKVCKMPGCDKNSRKLGWCSMHHSRIQRTGSPFDKDQSWVVDDYPACIYCGGDIPKGIGFRRYCSQRCAARNFYGKEIGTKDCVTCGSKIDLSIESGSGKRKYSSTSYCNDCRTGVNLSSFVSKLEILKGTECNICSLPIDMTLKYPDPMSRSVDHIIPRSLGGTEALENLALAHFSCNSRKQNKVEFTLTV